ncbi:MAG: IS1182 family transposase [Planctomycetota bacterium]|jgi:transposase
MGKWADPQIDRLQHTLFAPTLDAMIEGDHPVRLFDELLRAMDWSAWEARYALTLGQPPIHPRVLAGIILYGLTRGLKSSRQLEYACQSSIDFMWLAERQTIDHATVCGFRNRFRTELKDLFKQLGRLAMRMGLVRLNEMALDGTRIKANSSRHGTATAKTLEARLAALDASIETMLSEAQAADEQEALFGSDGTPAHLPRSLSDAQGRRARLAKALAAAKAKEASAGTKATPAAGSAAAPVRPACADTPQAKRAPKVPVADPDSTVQPNKEGGFAPNYTALLAVDGTHGLIVDAEVLPDGDEGAQALATVDRVEAAFGEQPERFLGDGAYGSGANLAGLEARGVEGFIPQAQREDTAANPAKRGDPTAPVAESEWAALPRNGRTKKLDRAAFVFDRAQDCYFCPMGHRLGFLRRQDRHRQKGRVGNRLYRGTACVGCPLAGECVAGKRAYRTVSRDEYEDLREAMDERLGTAEGKAIYRRRSWLAEMPNAVVKEQMGVRQFLTRGLEQVKTEWWWVCTAFNLGKMVRLVLAMRRRLWALVE